MESLLKNRAFADQGIGLGDILAGVGGVLQAAGAGISRLARETGESVSDVGMADTISLSADSLMRLRKIQGTLKNNWSAASSTTVTIRNGQITRWTLAKGKQMMVAQADSTAPRRAATTYAPRENEEIRGLDDLFPEKPIGFFEESRPASVRADSQSKAIAQPSIKSSRSAMSVSSWSATQHKPMTESASRKEGGTWSSLLFDESVRRKVRWPVENTAEYKSVAVSIAESRFNAPGDDAYISDEVALSYQVNLDSFMADTHTAEDACFADEEGALDDVQCPEDEVLDARSEAELLDRFLDGQSGDHGENAVFVQAEITDIEPIAAIEPEADEWVDIHPVADTDDRDHPAPVFPDSAEGITSDIDAISLSQVMTPLVEAPPLQAALKNAASEGWHEFQERVTRWFKRGDKRAREKKLIEFDDLSEQRVDSIMQGDVDAHEIENCREKLTPLKPRIKELDEEFREDLTSFELLARNNRIIANSIHNLVDQYFYQSALAEDENDSYY